MEKCNFNLLACHNYDVANGNIEGIFNSTILKDDRCLTFDLLTILNFIDKQFDRLIIFYCIYNVSKGERSAKIINKSVFTRTDGVSGVNGRSRKTALMHLSSAVKSLRISNMKFTEKGDYEIRAYAFWDEECDNITKKEVGDILIDELILKPEHMASVINIEVM